MALSGRGDAHRRRRIVEGQALHRRVNEPMATISPASMKMIPAGERLRSTEITSPPGPPSSSTPRKRATSPSAHAEHDQEADPLDAPGAARISPATARIEQREHEQRDRSGQPEVRMVEQRPRRIADARKRRRSHRERHRRDPRATRHRRRRAGASRGHPGRADEQDDRPEERAAGGFVSRGRRRCGRRPRVGRTQVGAAVLAERDAGAVVGSTRGQACVPSGGLGRSTAAGAPGAISRWPQARQKAMPGRLSVPQRGHGPLAEGCRRDRMGGDDVRIRRCRRAGRPTPPPRWAPAPAARRLRAGPRPPAVAHRRRLAELVGRRVAVVPLVILHRAMDLRPES